MFLYYLPNKAAGLPLSDVRAAGLGYAIEVAPASVGVRGGPDGGNGVLLCDGKLLPAEQLRYQPDAQTWRKIPGIEAWVGRYSNPQSHIPDPSLLARPKQLAGHQVVLADGQLWLVPVARGWIEEDGDLRWYANVPQISVLGDDGRWSADGVLPKFAPLWDLALRWEQSRSGATLDVEPDGSSVRLTFDFSGLHEGAVLALQTNYRIGPAEMALLGLLTADISREILDAVIDLPTREEWFKKKQRSGLSADGLNTAAG